MAAVDGDAILEHATWFDTTGVLPDIMGLARRAYPGSDENYATHRVADFFARYPHMWADMDPVVRSPTPQEDTRQPVDYVNRAKDFLKRWAVRVHGREPGLSPDQCWYAMQGELARELRFETYAVNWAGSFQGSCTGSPEGDDAQADMQQGLTD